MWPQWIDLGDENNAGEPVVDTTMPAAAEVLEPLNLPIVKRGGYPKRVTAQDSGFRYWAQGKRKNILRPAPALIDPTQTATAAGQMIAPANAPAATATPVATSKAPDNSITLFGITFTPLMLAALGGGLLLALYMFGNMKGGKR